MDRAVFFGMVLGAFLLGARMGATAWAQTSDLPNPAPAAPEASSPPAAPAQTPTPAPTAPTATPATTDTDQPHPVDTGGPTVRSTFDDQDLKDDHPASDDGPDVRSSFDRQDTVDEHPVP